MRQHFRSLCPFGLSPFSLSRWSGIAFFVCIGLSAQPEVYQNEVFTVQQVSLGGENVGIHLFSAVVVNNTDSAREFALDIRTEACGLGHPNRQVQFSFPFQPKETRTIQAEYEIATPLLQRVIVRFGEAPAYNWRKLVQADPKASDSETLRSSIRPYGLFLSQISAERVSQIRHALPGLKQTRAEDALRERLRGAFRIAPVRSGGFDHRKEAWLQEAEGVTALFSENKITAEPFSIASADGARISAFVAIPKSASVDDLPTIFLLTGNPPGTKESQVLAAVFFAKLGYRAVGVDRRLSSRLLDTKAKFLTNFSDPVNDLIRLIDYFAEKYPRSPFGVMGISAGAAEAQFAAALDPRISAAVLACGIASQNSFFKDDAWVPTYSGMIIFPELGLGEPTIGKLTREEFDANLAKLTPGDHAQARQIFRKTFPFFDDMDSMKVAPLIAPTPLLIVSGAQDSQFKPEGVVDVDQAIQQAYRKYGLRAVSDLYIEPRAEHFIDSAAGMVIAAFFDRWLR